MVASINVLTVNAGSSSLKATVFPMDGRPPQRLFEIMISTIGEQSSIIRWHSSDGAEDSRKQHIADHAAAAQAMLQVLEQYQLLMSITSVGHRLVHGGQ